MDIDSRISNEKKRLSVIFNDIQEDKKSLVEKLLDNAAFMSVTLEELQNIIKEEGAIIVSTNGNGFETRTEHPAQKSYNTMIQRYGGVIKQLVDLLPDGKADSTKAAGEALAQFIAKGKPKGRGKT